MTTHTMLSGQFSLMEGINKGMMESKAKQRSCDSYCDRHQHRWETGGWEVNLNSGGAGKLHGGHTELGLEKYPVMEKWIRISGIGNRWWECTEVACFQKHGNLGNSCTVKWCEIEL